MRFLLDEQVTGALAPTLTALNSEDTVVHLLSLVEGQLGVTDDEVVELCERHNFDALITINVKDFGARKHYFAALQQRGIHVLVVRPAKAQPDAYQQVALITGQFGHVRRLLATAEGPCLVKITRTDARLRTLEQLIQEMSGLP